MRADIKTIMSKVIEIAVLVTLKNHCYCFDGRIYRQRKSGAIGLRLTRIVCRLVMDRWAWALTTGLMCVRIELDMIAKYVDDMNTVLPLIPYGMRWPQPRRKTEHWEYQARREQM